MKKVLYGMVILTLVLLDVLLITMIIEVKKGEVLTEQQVTVIEKPASSSSPDTSKGNTTKDGGTQHDSTSTSPEDQKGQDESRTSDKNAGSDAKPPSSSTSSNARQTGTGSMKGVVTWQYNDDVGTKPDVGARVALIKWKPKQKYDDKIFGLTLASTDSLEKQGIYSAKADGYGNYILDNIPEGTYLCIIRSEKTMSDLTMEDETKKAIDELFAAETSENLKRHLMTKKHVLEIVEITEGEAFTYSHDFGYTYF
ncbi:MAG: hypothetical protein IKE34_11585 [Paenibacillus sp.]|nr:hypothetical protein [Paenibacillus sp.]